MKPFFFYMNRNDKTIASLQPNVSLRHYYLKVQANEINFENCSAQHYFKNTYCNPFQSIFFNFVHPHLLLYLLCY